MAHADHGRLKGLVFFDECLECEDRVLLDGGLVGLMATDPDDLLFLTVLGRLRETGEPLWEEVFRPRVSDLDCEAMTLLRMIDAIGARIAEASREGAMGRVSDAIRRASISAVP